MTNALTVFKQTLKSDAVMDSIHDRLKEKSGVFVTSLLDLCGETKELLECSPGLVIKEAMKAAGLDLPLNKNLGFAYIIPYKERGIMTPHFQMGYKGFIQLAIRTGLYKHLNAEVVYEGEVMIVDKIKGTLYIEGEPTSERAIAYFSYMQLINGFEKAIGWTKKKVEAHAVRFSKSYAYYKNNPRGRKPVWATDFDQMALKTMILQLVPKYGPMTIQMSQAMGSESKQDFAGFKRSPEQEINENANQDIIDVDVKGDDDDVVDAEMTDEEKEEIVAREKAQSEEEEDLNPGF